jgi:hypothetical protein
MEVKGCGFGYALTECERLRKEWKALSVGGVLILYDVTGWLMTKGALLDKSSPLDGLEVGGGVLRNNHLSLALNYRTEKFQE